MICTEIRQETSAKVRVNATKTIVHRGTERAHAAENPIIVTNTMAARICQRATVTIDRQVIIIHGTATLASAMRRTSPRVARTVPIATNKISPLVGRALPAVANTTAPTATSTLTPLHLAPSPPTPFDAHPLCRRMTSASNPVSCHHAAVNFSVATPPSICARGVHPG